MTSAYEVRPTTYGRVIGLGLGKFRFVGSGVALVLAALLPSTVASVALAGPVGGKVAAGNATITHQGNRTIIRASDGSIINYSSFDLNPNESVRFIQPGSTARVLNRITGDAPTTLNGTITANGIVYFANRAGVIFGPNSVINVGGIYAAAGSISNRDFLGGTDHFTNIHGEVSNAGAIDAKFAALVGERIVNTGTIDASGGMIAMVAGNEVTLSPRGGTMSVKVSQPTPGMGKAAIENSGTLRADGGSAFMVAGDMYSLAVKNTGNIRARRVKIEGLGNAGVQVSGAIDASNQRDGASGGSIEITGRTVDLLGANLDASGRRAGGEILVGGDYQGLGTLRNAQTTHVDADSAIRADATGAGKGGKVIVWSDRTTTVYGDISASGGARSGDGGLIETSGKINLDIRGASIQARARSSSGKGGLWMMDPVNVTIAAAPDNGATATTAGGTTTFDPDNSVSPAVVDVATINAALNGGTNVTVITGSVGADAGNITVNAAVSKTAGADATFTLRAANNVVVNSTIGSTSGRLNVDLQANADGAGNIDTNLSAGDVTINAAITTNGGTFSSSGVGYTQNAGGTIATAGGDATILHTGVVAVDDTLIAGGAAHVLVQGSTFSASAAVMAGTGGMDLRPADAASDIRLNNGAGDFNLSAATLGNLALLPGSLLTIGAAAGTGNVLVGSSGDIDLSSLDANLLLRGATVQFNGALAFNASRTLTLTSGGVQDNHSGVDVTGGTLALNLASGSATLGSSVGTLAASGVAGDLTLDNATNLSVGAITIGGNLDLHVSGTITSTGDMSVTGASTFVSRKNGGAAINVGSAMSDFGGTVTARSRNAADSADDAGTITINAGSGITLAQLTTTGAADLTIVGDMTITSAAVGGTLTFSGGGNATITSTPTLHLGASSAVGLLTITAPDIDITGTVSAGSQGIILQPSADSKTIGINSAGVDFAISLAEMLNLSTSGAVTIGRVTGTGFTLIGSLGAVDLSSTAYDLTLRGGQAMFADTLTLSDNSLLTLRTIGVASPNSGTDVVIGGTGSVLLDASAAVDLTTQVALLAGGTSVGTITVANTGALEIGSIGMVNGLTGASGQTLTVTATGDLTLSQAVSAAGAAAISLTSTTGDVVFATAGTAATDLTGSVTVTAAQSILAPAVTTSQITAGTVTLTATAGDIGGANALRTDATTLTATVGGDATIDNLGTDTLDAQIAGAASSLVSLTSAGTISLGMGHTITGDQVTLAATDLDLAGTIVAGSTINLRRSASGTIGVGDAAGDMTISKTELSHLTAATLNIGGTNTTLVTADNVAEADQSAIGAVNLLALADGGNVTFSGTTSTFHHLGVRADDSINVNVDLVSSLGALTLTADDDMAADAGGDKINIAGGVTISTSSPSGGDITLTATGGVAGAGVCTIDSNAALTIQSAYSSAGALTLRAKTGITLNGPGTGTQVSLLSHNGVTISDDLTTSVGLTINADADADGTGLFALAAGKTISTTSTNLSITCADIQLDGMINAGAATVAVAPAVAKTIGLGTATGDIQISGAELSHITCGTLSLGSVLTSSIAVDTVAAGDTANIAYLMILLANDVDIAGAFNTSNASLAIARGTAGDISVGLAVGGLNLSNAELALITTHNLQIGGGATSDIFVNGVAGSDTANMSGAVTLLGNGTISFLSNASTFKALTVNARNGIRINRDLTTTVDDMALNGDTNNSADGDDAITIGSGRTLDSAGALTLRSSTSGIVGIGSLTLNAGAGITLFNDLTTSGLTTIDADHDADNTGTLVISSGRTVSTSGNDLHLSAADLLLDGSLAANAGAVSITRTGSGTIGLGLATGDMTITGAELGRIIATGLTIGGSSITGLTVNGVTATNSNGIAGGTTLIAGSGSMTFNGTASIFNSLDARASGGITVAVALSTDNGTMRLDGNSDSTGSDAITLSANITSDIPPAPNANPTVGFNIVLDSDVLLGANVVVTGRDATFNGKIDSSDATSRALTVNTINSGVTSFGGDIGSTNPLFTLATNRDGLTRIGGNIATNGSIGFSDAIKLTADTTITVSAGEGVFFNSTVDTAASSPTARSLTLLTRRNGASGAVNFPVISFAQSVGSIKPLANLYLNYDGTMAGDGRPNVPGIATIYARQRDASANVVVTPSTPFDMAFELTGTFRMGQNEKLTSVGSLTINAPTSAVLGDLTSTGSMTVNSPSITLQRRAGARILGYQGLFGHDDGLDFVSGGTINFTSAPVAVGTGISPRFGTVDGSGDVSSTLSAFVFQAFGPMDISYINSTAPTLRTLDLKSSGPTNTNLADTIAGAVPRESRQNDVGEGVTVGQAQFEQIKQLGIVPRNPTAGELVELLTGSATFDDVPHGSANTAEDYTTVVNRLPSSSVSALLDAYDAVFNKPLLDEAGKPVLDPAGALRRTSRAQEIQDALLASVRRFRDAMKAKPGAPADVDPGVFRAFLEQNEQEAESLGYIRELNVFLNKLDRVGLTARELAQSKAIILNPVRPRGIKSVQQFEAVIRAESSRVLK
jgi:filamentous hemagglutinin family protein